LLLWSLLSLSLFCYSVCCSFVVVAVGLPVRTIDKHPQLHVLPVGWRSRLVGCFPDCRRRSVGFDPRHGRVMAAVAVAPTTCAKQEAFTGALMANLFTDGGPFSAYQNVHVPAVQEHHKVTHSQHEYARASEVTKSGRDGSKREGMAGTQAIDGAWRRIERYVPDECSGKMLDTDAGRQVLAMHIRLGQWHYMIGVADIFVKFAEAVQGYMREVDSGFVTDADILAAVEGDKRLPAAGGWRVRGNRFRL
jgi:hypothetical protein